MARILVADDEEMVRTLLRRFLESAGHEVVEAVNGAEAHSLYLRESFDLLVTDNAMPRMSGAELIRAIRHEGSAARIIAMTAFDIRDMVQHGVQGALQKPFRREGFLAKVEEVLRAPEDQLVAAAE